MFDTIASRARLLPASMLCVTTLLLALTAFANNDEIVVYTAKKIGTMDTTLARRSVLPPATAALGYQGSFRL